MAHAESLPGHLAVNGGFDRYKGIVLTSLVCSIVLYVEDPQKYRLPSGRCILYRKPFGAQGKLRLARSDRDHSLKSQEVQELGYAFSPYTHWVEEPPS